MFNIDYIKVYEGTHQRIRKNPIASSGFRISQGKTKYKSGIKEITGVQMLNNSMTVTDKFKNAFAEEMDMNAPRAKGLLNYQKRIRLVSKAKK